jgi:hypothetical protein
MRAIALLLAALSLGAQSVSDRDVSWSEFLAWFRGRPSPATR